METHPGESLPQPGWYPDPFARHEFRYWDGRSWTSRVASGGVQSEDLPMPPGMVPLPLEVDRARLRERVIARRVLWNLYAVPITLLLVTLTAVGVVEGLPFSLVDAMISTSSLLALHLHVWDKRFLSPLVWRLYSLVFITWEILLLFFILPALGQPFSVASFVIMIVLIPLYVATFRYAFRKWGDPGGRPNQGINLTSA